MGSTKRGTGAQLARSARASHIANARTYHTRRVRGTKHGMGSVLWPRRRSASYLPLSFPCAAAHAGHRDRSRVCASDQPPCHLLPAQSQVVGDVLQHCLCHLLCVYLIRRAVTVHTIDRSRASFVVDDALTRDAAAIIVPLAIPRHRAPHTIPARSRVRGTRETSRRARTMLSRSFHALFRRSRRARASTRARVRPSATRWRGAKTPSRA